MRSARGGGAGATTGWWILDNRVADAPPLGCDAESVTGAQLGDFDKPLPRLQELCAALGVSETLSDVPEKQQQQLPRRILDKRASEAERSLWKFTLQNHVHEYLSSEFVDLLAFKVANLLRAPTRADSACSNPLPVVLELGAGNGALAFHLSARLRDIARVVATDSAAAENDGQNPTQSEADAAASTTNARPLCRVLRRDAETAVSEFNASVVICSWMPSGVDWTASIRNCPSTRAYILIGAGFLGDGTCGDPWATWGQLPPNFEEYGLDEDDEPPFVEDGFQIVSGRQARNSVVDVELQAWQIGRFDSAQGRGFSGTVIFQRSGPAEALSQSTAE